jgi:DNA-binding NarL/FixJ family response regulator
VQFLIADDHEAITLVAARLIELAFEGSTVRTVHCVERLFGALDDMPADALVLDLCMPGHLKRIELLRAVVARPDAPRVLVYSSESSPCLVAAVLEAGATGFVPKGSPVSVLAAGIAAVGRGERYVDPSIECDGAAHPWRTLTPAERDVLRLLMRGQTMKQIAAETNRTYTTAATLRASGMRKLNLRANGELAPYIHRHGLLFELDGFCRAGDAR